MIRSPGEAASIFAWIFPPGGTVVGVGPPTVRVMPAVLAAPTLAARVTLSCARK